MPTTTFQAADSRRDLLIHDIRTPLATISGYAQLLLRRPVVVTVQQADAWAVVNVADGGVGIPAAELPRIFERGYRASNVVERFHGTGLGLAGVHHIVTEHGGTIVVETQIGIGTTTTVRLPLEEPRDE